MSRRLAIGDIHGSFSLLKDVLERSNFDYENDLLIILGDVVNRGSKPYECVEELLKIKKKLFVLGNHDYRLKRFLNNEMTEKELAWWSTSKASQPTYAQYKDSSPESHREFFNSAKYYEIIDENLFVHAGYDDNIPIEFQFKHVMITTKETIHQAKIRPLKGFKKVFIGHMPTTLIGSKDAKPLFLHNLIALDTGSFSSGRITIMDIDTLEYWQSNPELLDKVV